MYEWKTFLGEWHSPRTPESVLNLEKLLRSKVRAILSWMNKRNLGTHREEVNGIRTPQNGRARTKMCMFLKFGYFANGDCFVLFGSSFSLFNMITLLTYWARNWRSAILNSPLLHKYGSWMRAIHSSAPPRVCRAVANITMCVIWIVSAH